MASGHTDPLSEILLDTGDTNGRAENLTAWIDDVKAEYEKARVASAALLGTSRHLAEMSDALAERIHMRFLYDTGRRFFAIGYPVGGPVQFTSHYDLLASEARLGQPGRDCQGRVPVEHWFALSRPYMSPGAARYCFPGAAPCLST